MDKKNKRRTSLVPTERIEQSILLLRGQKVMLDSDLAALYGIQSKRLLEAVKRNWERFPDDFAFQLNEEEFGNLRSQFATSSSWGGRRYAPYAFTEQGVAMLSSVLRSPRAVASAGFTVSPGHVTLQGCTLGCWAWCVAWGHGRLQRGGG